MLRFLSLTGRLTLFFTAVAASIVLGLCILFILASERHFIELDQMAMQDKQQLIEDILAGSNNTEDARQRLSDALVHHHGLFVMVKDPKGDLLFKTAGFEPPQAALSPATSPEKSQIQKWKNQGGEFRSMFLSGKTGSSTEPVQDILIAIDLAHHTHFMRELQHTLMVYGSLAVVISGLLGWLAAYKGMAPLRAMKSRATTVSAQQLNARMPIDAVPFEMADLAQALNQMLDRLQNDFQRLSDFSSDLAHELRTPVSNLLTQTQVALSSKRDAETYREILASNAEEFQRLGRMVSDMLFLAKTERGVNLPGKERFSAAEEVRALMEFYDAVADEKQIQMRQSGNGMIFGDRLMFRRAVSNLLSNALRHTHEKGDVNIDISETGQLTRVSVENTGEDIDPLVLPRLFDRFYRADPARARPESDGAGLGLSITQAIVQAHNGRVTAMSECGKTKFCLEWTSHEKP
jgi:two-component system, OmpR family, heavy metal sensor histidine kinase CusS